jgi:hypothetical protein
MPLSAALQMIIWTVKLMTLCGATLGEYEKYR